MSTSATNSTASYSQGDYNIVIETAQYIPNVINFTARNIKNLNTKYTGSINDVNSHLKHKITCAFVYDRYTIVESDNTLVITFNLYDDTTLNIELVKLDYSI